MSTVNPFFGVKTFTTGALVAATASRINLEGLTNKLITRDLSGNGGGDNQPGGCRQLRSIKIELIGSLTGPVYMAFGGPAVVATANDIAINANDDVFALPVDATHVSFLSAADTPTVFATIGSGE